MAELHLTILAGQRDNCNKGEYAVAPFFNTPSALSWFRKHVFPAVKTCGRFGLFLMVTCMSAGAVSDLASTADTAVPPSPSAAVLQAAQTGLPVYLSHIALRKTTYGFLESDDLSQAKLGQPIELFLLPDSMLHDATPNMASASELPSAAAWFVPVQIGGQSRGLIEVVQTGGQWKAASLGYAPLARKWAQVETWWPNRSGFTPRLVVSASTGYYFSIPQVHPANLTALDSIVDPRLGKTTTAPPSLIPWQDALTPLKNKGPDISTQFGALNPSSPGAQP